MRHMILTNLVEIHSIKNNTIYVRVLDGRDFTVAELKKAYKVFEKNGNGKPYRVIIDARDITVGHIPMEAFKLNSHKKNTPNQIAEVYLFNSLHIKILINFYFKLFKPVVPSKMCMCIEEANIWLTELDTTLR